MKKLSKTKISVTLIIITMTVVIVCFTFFLLCQKKVEPPEPRKLNLTTPLMISTSGLITQIENNTIFLERYAADAIDKETIKVKVTDQTVIKEITYKAIPSNFSENIEELSEEETRFIEETDQCQEKIISFADLKIGDDLEAQAAKNIHNKKEFTAVEIRVVVQETNP